MLPQWIEFTPEEEAILDEIWSEIAAEQAAAQDTKAPTDEALQQDGDGEQE
jgi:hypothetical protein